MNVTSSSVTADRWCMSECCCRRKFRHKLITHPSSFMTDLSPQSQAPPACDRNMLKSCVEWSPRWKHSRQMDIHGDIPHVRHRYATTRGIHTRPHLSCLSKLRTGTIIKYNVRYIITRRVSNKLMNLQITRGAREHLGRCRGSHLVDYKSYPSMKTK